MHGVFSPACGAEERRAHCTFCLPPAFVPLCCKMAPPTPFFLATQAKRGGPPCLFYLLTCQIHKRATHWAALIMNNHVFIK
ncbi:hypothetical protein APA386B_1926 [Acetobacter pasteurianus 386B]|nr:hypothetical protein APA386B_1926 [Acetobacter pasteurianus 386B]